MLPHGAFFTFNHLTAAGDRLRLGGGGGRRLKKIFAVKHKRARFAKSGSLPCSSLLSIELRATSVIDGHNSIRKNHAINMHKPRVYPRARREIFEEVCFYGSLL
ncbi:predicted protein [Lichtheimia corymbifera JMRC:FSU:9682]|uniref:Uncharacterized protein n=1 Tax=Lichtheimia corymbifera JMRC:FSU:9682 TaxID=1263082 RepID=A0A068S839_9FUNG|nr:predicted protein [Lichtheimia corymbifera JMRC:FSU:9682]